MKLFEIADVDLTTFITVPSYKVNRTPVYEEWTDANGINHREIYRTRVSGSFNVKFMNTDDYFMFINLVKDNTGAAGYTPVSCYLNNLNTVVNVNVYVSFDPSDDLPYLGTNKANGFDVSIEER